MKTLRNSRVLKVMAVFLTVNMISQIIVPNMAWALTSGPSQPEFSSFEPVTTTNMVDPFTGSFTYNLPVLNVPGPNGGGYAVSLSYHSGVSPDEEASWVGLGWTLNPGAINRNKRGFADDIYGEKITTHHKSAPSHTAVVTPKLGIEIFSADDLTKVVESTGVSASISKSVRYNNYTGYASDLSFSLSALDGIANIGFTKASDGDFGINASVNPAGLLSLGKKSKMSDKVGRREKNTVFSKPSEASKKARGNTSLSKAASILSSTASAYGMSFLPDINMQMSGSNTKGKTYMADYTGQTNPASPHIGADLGGSIRYSYMANEEKNQTDPAYGYLYMNDGGSGENKGKALTDFSIEKESEYNHRDNYLPAPFSSKDVFSLTGEGAGGSFQLFHKSIGHVHRQSITSTSSYASASTDLSGGVNSGIGFGISKGSYESKFESWDVNNSNLYRFSPSSSAIMRFNGDLSGNVQYSDPNVITSDVGSRIPDDISPYMLVEAKASSFVAYNTVNEIQSTIENKLTREPVYYKAFDKSFPGKKAIENEGGSINFGKTIAEISTVNKDGQRMNYSLPVYNSNEKSMSYSVEGYEPFKQKSFFEGVESYDNSKHLVERKINNEDDIDFIQGTKATHKYASTYLLTSIVNSDYIDRKFDGPTADDFGGWTKFNYTENPKTYHWRMPYSGLTYTANAKLNPDDDKGSFSSGDKEIYFLKSVETKTHIAYFITNKTDETVTTSEDGTVALKGSGVSREDALCSADDETAANSIGAQGTVEKEKLERIVLFAKGSNGTIIGRPIQTTHFEYTNESGDEYSLCKNTLNSKELNHEERTGKLTLKRVWFEYEGVKNAKIRPYEFEYEYATYSNEIANQYSDIAMHASALSSADQNPNYKHNISDPWGNYRGDGDERDENEMPWIDQSGENKPNIKFDPAAWHLKQIILPSGGEIHVQYDQHDYSYVQDKKAMALVSIASVDNPIITVPGTSIGKIKYQLDLTDFDLDPAFDVSSYATLLNNKLSGEKVYFKFLYKLIANAYDIEPASINDCRSDYVTGWMDVEEVLYENNGVYLVTSSSDSNRPEALCKDVVKRKYKGLAYKSDCYTSLAQDFSDELAVDVLELYDHLIGMVGAFVPGDSWQVCASMDPTFSFFKIPVPVSKRGGGVRVKRLLSYSDGIETGDESIYGTEYEYKFANGISSGVATNEPAGLRDENANIHFLKKRDARKVIQKITSGVGKEQFEGPYGESVLPGASIGYERVVVSNIHKGKTAPGFMVETFNTARRYPILFYNDSYIPSVNKFITGPTPLYQANKRWAKGFQEYVIIKNDMHGKPDSKSTYRGAYNTVADINESNLVASTIFNYFHYKSKVPVLGNDGMITEQFMGREEDVIMDGRLGEDGGKTIELQNDPSFTAPSVLMYSLLNYVKDNYSEFKRHVTTKVINYTGIAHSVASMQNGISSTTTNLAFDSNTGQAVITSTTDGFNNVSINGTNHDGRYLSYTIPAAKVYPHLGQKIKNEGFVMEVGSNLSAPITLMMDCIGEREEWLGNDGTCQIDASFINLQSDEAKIKGKGLENYFQKKNPNEDPMTDGTNRAAFISALDNGRLIEGDLIELSSSDGRGLYYINEIDLHNRHRIYLNPVSFTSNTASGKDPKFTRLEVISSGYSNQLTPAAASITTYGQNMVSKVINKTPYQVDGVTGTPQITLNNYGTEVAMGTEFRNVVASSAVVYSDDWYNYNLTDAYSDVEYSCLRSNTFETGARGKWRPKSTYVYKDVLTPNEESEIRNKGFVDNLIPFVFRKSNAEVYNYVGLNDGDRSTKEDYLSSHVGSSTGEYVNIPENDSKWVKSNTVTMYSPNGEALEEESIMKVRSSAKFGYGQNVPVLVAANAPYRCVLFEGFDDRNDDFITTNNKHSGNKAAILITDQELVLGKIEGVNDLNLESRMTYKMWVHASTDISALEIVLDKLNDSDIQNDVIIQDVTQSNVSPLVEIARVGEWVLVQKENIILPNEFNYRRGNELHSQGPGSEYQIKIKNTGTAPLYLDDVRMQPAESQMTAYVYDNENLRLLATFDDQHFGLFYQYNAEGKLVRKLIETERGLKTVTETQYHTPSKER